LHLKKKEKKTLLPGPPPPPGARPRERVDALCTELTPRSPPPPPNHTGKIRSTSPLHRCRAQPLPPRARAGDVAPSEELAAALRHLPAYRDQRENEIEKREKGGGKKRDGGRREKRSKKVVRLQQDPPCAVRD